MRLSALCFTAVLWIGCSAPVDMTPPDASTPDAGPADAGQPDTDAGLPDAGPLPPVFKSWDLLDGGPTVMGKQDDVYFIDENQGWSVNGFGRVYKTTDSGKSWNKVLDQPGTYFRAVTFFDANRGFVSNIGTGYYPGVTDPVPLYLTTNGGTSFTPVTTFNGPTPKGICNFSKLDDQHIFATGRVGGPSFVLSSADQGATWTSTDVSSQIAMLVDSHFSSPMEGLITGGSATTNASQCLILRTTDGGQTWTEAFRSIGTNRMCWKLSFPTDMIGYASVQTFGSQQSTFLKTADGGKTWAEFRFVTGSYAALGIGFINENTGWIGGEGTGKPAYRTDDGGLTWVADNSLGPYINRFRFVGNKAGFAIGASVFKLEIQ
jgi:photosystem II stability/assembly factor-like uncharacterized protein